MRTVVSREWVDMPKHREAKFRTFARTVMEDAWWHETEALVKSIKPIYSVLRITDMEGSTMGLLYEFMDKIGESLDGNTFLPPSQ